MIATRIYRCSKNGARDLQIFEEYVFYQVRKMVTGLQRKWWFSKTLKKAYTSDKIEAYRFSLWFYKNSIRWSLPKKCITSLLILTFLKFNEKRNIIHAHWNLISQFVPYEKSVRRCPSLKILQDAPKTDRATFKFLKSMCFIKCENWSLVCSENGDFQNH